MEREQFIAKVTEVFDRAVAFQEKSRREGLLSIEYEIDSDKCKQRDIFEFGMQFVVDGTNSELIDTILSRIIEHESDPYMK